MKYVIDSKTYEKHIRDEVHLYGLLHQLAFLAGKVKDEEDMANLVETSKHYGEIAEKKFDDWLIPGRYLAFGDRDDLAELKAAELTPLTAVLKEHDAKIREKQRAASSNDPAYIISGSAFRMLVGDLFDLLAQYGYLRNRVLDYCDRFGFSQVPEFLQPERAAEVTIPTPEQMATQERISTPRGSFCVTNMTREQMEAAGYGVHHQSDDGKYLIMGNGTRAFAVLAQQPEQDNPLRTAEMTLEDDYGMIDGVINNGRRGEELEKAQEYAERTTPEKPSIRERLEDAKRECAEHKPPEGKKPGRDVPEHDCL